MGWRDSFNKPFESGILITIFIRTIAVVFTSIMWFFPIMYISLSISGNVEEIVYINPIPQTVIMGVVCILFYFLWMSVIAAATAIHWLTYDCSVALLYSTEQRSRHSDADNKRGDTGNRWIDGWVVLLTICVPTKVVWRVGRANSSNKSLPDKKCSNANQWQPVTGIFKQFLLTPVFLLLLLFLLLPQRGADETLKL